MFPCALPHRLPATYFLALEDSDLCARRLCGAYRGLTLHLKDASGSDVLRCKRPFACTCLCGLPCCCFTYLNPQTMDIVTMAPGGIEGPKLGSVRQAGSCFSLSNKLEVLDANDSVIYILSAYSLQCGPNCICHEYEFKIETPDGTHTGASIKNVYPGTTYAARVSRAPRQPVHVLTRRMHAQGAISVACARAPTTCRWRSRRLRRPRRAPSCWARRSCSTICSSSKMAACAAAARTASKRQISHVALV